MGVLFDFASPVLKGPNDYGFDYSFATAGSAEMNPSTFIENNRATAIPTLSSQEAEEKYGERFGRDDKGCRRRCFPAAT